MDPAVPAPTALLTSGTCSGRMQVFVLAPLFEGRMDPKSPRQWLPESALVHGLIIGPSEKSPDRHCCLARIAPATLTGQMQTVRALRNKANWSRSSRYKHKTLQIRVACPSRRE